MMTKNPLLLYNAIQMTQDSENVFPGMSRHPGTAHWQGSCHSREEYAGGEAQLPLLYKQFPAK